MKNAVFYLMLAFIFLGYVLLAFVSSQDDLAGRYAECRDFQEQCMAELTQCRLGAENE